MEIKNKVAESGIITIDLLDYKPKTNLLCVDLKEQLWEELVLKEKEFRNWVKNHNWEQYKNQFVAVFSSADAIIPQWAYMLVASELQNQTKQFFFDIPEKVEIQLWINNLKSHNMNDYKDKRIVVKGCGEETVPYQIYAEFTRLAQPYVLSIMFGEPCSTVPVYKKPK